MKRGDPAPRHDVLGVLLAGGKSSRMHTDKSAVRLGERNLALWAAAVLEQVTPESIQVGGGHIAELDWPRMPDLRRDCGPAAGVEAGLTAAHAIQVGGIPIAVLAVDIPFMPPELLRSALDEVVAGACVAAPYWRDRWHPLCAAYSPAALEPLQQQLNDGKLDLQRFLNKRATRIGPDKLRNFGDPDAFLMNVNTPEDLERAHAILEAGAL